LNVSVRCGQVIAAGELVVFTIPKTAGVRLPTVGINPQSQIPSLEIVSSAGLVPAQEIAHVSVIGSLTDTSQLSFQKDDSLKAGEIAEIYFTFIPEMTICRPN